MATRTVTFRAPESRIKALDKIAAQQQRDRSFLLNEAVESYLAMDAYNLEMLEEGLRQDDDGLHVSHEHVLAELAALANTIAKAKPSQRKRAS